MRALQPLRTATSGEVYTVRSSCVAGADCLHAMYGKIGQMDLVMGLRGPCGQQVESRPHYQE